ncbi:hypothetical protein H1V43_06100 [Streptomyces sp. PSKA54]|uniref:Uncharacterized protein n=1 Tax=Streptomyces himalayensis subsp. aureolus TaxID=2758039 RepID=A0A7W2CXJ5_9ACTN|nr:hypothetical protein [Streptomyces himalayensis subsp. aureolus]
MSGSLQRSIAKTVGAIKPWLYGPFPSALNGQHFRQSLFRSLVRAVDPAAIFESGTFHGASTQFFWNVSGRPIYTVEKNPGFAYCAKRRFRRIPEVRVLAGDSRAALKRLRNDDDFPPSRVLFYLDAHWEVDLPLREEVAFITKEWTDSVIVIDDFKVPDDSGYAFDTYDAGELSIEYLGAEAIGSYEVFWPRCPSSEETGARRGCGVLVAPDALTAVEELPELRRLPGRRAAAPSASGL